MKIIKNRKQRRDNLITILSSLLLLSPAILVFSGLFALIGFGGWQAHIKNVAESPERIARYAGIELPEYKVISKYDNYDRWASAWTEVGWRLKCVDGITPKLENRLKKLSSRRKRWTSDAQDSIYVYVDGELNEDMCAHYICVTPADSSVSFVTVWYDFLF